MIVIGIDDRPSARDALTLGRWLATAEDEELLLAWVHPYDRLPSLLDQGDEAQAVRAAIEAMAADVKATLPAELRSELRLVSSRSAAEGLQGVAEREQASLIVLGASERAGIGRIAPGATARRLLAGSTAPVAIAPRGYGDEHEHPPVIGVGFDGGAEAREALDWATALSRRVGGHLRLVAVHEPFAFSDVSPGAFPIESVGQALRRQLRDEVESEVTRLAVSADVGAKFRDGDPASELVAESADVDVLVMGSRGWGPVRAVLLGSVSDAVVAQSAAPVVVVPRGTSVATDA